jgi:hypothetical protein
MMLARIVSWSRPPASPQKTGSVGAGWRRASAGGAETGSDFKRFQKEMAALGIAVEWRVIERSDQEFHDRFIVTKGKAWNVPPVTTLYKGNYSEITATTAPPFEAWWAKGKPLQT